MTEDSGLVVVDKPGGMTSHDVVARVRRLAGTRKVGHAGTLDPMATGVLVLGINRATRLLGHLMLTEKAYDAFSRAAATASSDWRALASSSSRFRAFSGSASWTKVSDGTCRMPSCLPTSERSTPLADSSAAAELTRSASSPSTV